MAVIDDIKTLLGKTETNQTDQLKPNGPPKKLLIVEDEPILQEMYEHKFTLEKFEVHTADNGEDGLEKIQKIKPDIVLLDLMMPVMDGKTMLRKLREIPEFKTLPVIVLTNAGESDNIKETKRYDDACEFLIKSNINVSDIVEKVKIWVH